jgi:hypothetical protein
MAMKSQWATVEGGISNTFPLSINRNTFWTSLRRGECYYQDHAEFEKRGALSYSAKPDKSPQNQLLDFSETVYDPNQQIDEFFAYGRYWKISPDDARVLVFSDIYFGEDDPAYDSGAGILFADDGDDPIILVAPDGDGQLFVIKRSCGYLIQNVNQDTGAWKKSAPDYSIGTVYPSPGYTNSVINGYVALVWDAMDGNARRHYLWNGKTTIELSDDVRELTDRDSSTAAQINWSKSLVIVGPFVYDLNNKRVFYFSGAFKASFTSRAFYENRYTPIVIYRMAFLTDGKQGEFDATLEYGQAADSLQKSKTFKVKITPQSKSRIRHVWYLDMPVLCRVWRIKIENLTGCSISQIDADASLADTPDADDGSQ